MHQLIKYIMKHIFKQSQTKGMRLLLPIFVLLFSINAISQTYPAINGTPCENCVATGWVNYNVAIGQSPDLVTGNGVWPGAASGVLSNISGTSPSGGNMAFLGTVLEGSFVGEAISTNITGLVVGNSYTAQFYWQQCNVDFGGFIYSGGALDIKMNATTKQYTSSGVADGWNIASFTFTATNTSEVIVLGGNIAGKVAGSYGGSIVVDNYNIVACTPATSVSIAVIPPNCITTTGSATITATGATFYSVDGGAWQASNTFSSLTSGTHTYSTTSATLEGIAECNTTGPTTFTVAPSAPAQPLLSTVTQPTCTVATGSFTITNYDPSYTYTASPSGATISGGTVTGTAGTYTVTAAFSGCTSSASATINAQPLVSAPVITAVDPTCTVLTGGVSVTAPISGTIYTLTPGAITSSTGVFTGLAASSGSYTVTATLSTDGTCVSGPSNAVSISGPATGCVEPCAPAAGTITITP
jgi:hypothetical protein